MSLVVSSGRQGPECAAFSHVWVDSLFPGHSLAALFHLSDTSLTFVSAFQADGYTGEV